MTAKTGYKTGFRSVRNYMIAGLIAGALLVFGWLDGCGRTRGRRRRTGNRRCRIRRKKVQHPSGGVIGSIMVKEGQHAKLGTQLLGLDDTITHANLAVVEKSQLST